MAEQKAQPNFELERQDSCEMEIIRAEADLYQHYQTCPKNPGHKNFISAPDFSLHHLPSAYRRKEILDLVQVVSSLTVRVEARLVSDRRPAYFPGTDEVYPFFLKANTGHKEEGTGTAKRVGSGWVKSVDIFGLEQSDKFRCECRDCSQSDTPRTQFSHIDILTAAHVIFDQKETAGSTCDLFFDSGPTPDQCPGVVTLDSPTCVWSDVWEDRSRLRFISHDLQLAQMLQELCQQRFFLCQDVSFIFQQQRGSGKDSLNILVSHPHGCSKQVSVGTCVTTDCRGYDYNTPTCPGSSGAPMIWEGEDIFWNDCGPHCGTRQKEANLNYTRYRQPSYWL